MCRCVREIGGTVPRGKDVGVCLRSKGTKHTSEGDALALSRSSDPTAKFGHLVARGNQEANRDLISITTRTSL